MSYCKGLGRFEHGLSTGGEGYAKLLGGDHLTDGGLDQVKDNTSGKLECGFKQKDGPDCAIGFEQWSAPPMQEVFGNPWRDDGCRPQAAPVSSS